MTTTPSLAADTHVSPLVAGEARPPWRALLLLTAAVVVAHLMALGLMPSGLGSTAPPVASAFVTRTIVVAPPQPPPQPAAAAQAPAPPAAAAPAPKVARPAPPKRPRAITPPPQTPPVPSPPVLTADTSLDPTPAAPAAEAAV
ncbi:MAG: DUF3108 domain-containing protein, partial [Variovorax sp.]